MKCGFYKLDITPPLGCHLAGYTRERIADSVVDPLNVRAVAFQNKGTAILICCDLIGIPQNILTEIREHVAEYVGCQRKDITISCTHTHTGPNISSGRYAKDLSYYGELKHWIARAAQGALDDLKEASLFYGKTEVPDISFVRRYWMKDGNVRTNPGVGNPDIVGPTNPGDDELLVLKAVRENADDIMLVNFQVHPDVVGGNGISADYPGTVCDTLEGALPGTRVVYFNGASGDLNHINVNRPEGEIGGKKPYSVHMGRTIAGRALSVCTNMKPLEDGEVKTMERETVLLLKRPTPEQLVRYQEIQDHFAAGDKEWIKERYGEKMEFTTAVAEAGILLRYAKEPEEYKVLVSGASVGEAAFIGIPGEAFCEIGKRIKADSPFKLQFILGQANGYEGYLPTKDAFEVNGYESRSSRYRPGVAETLIDSGNIVARELAKV